MAVVVWVLFLFDPCTKLTWNLERAGVPIFVQGVVHYIKMQELTNRGLTFPVGMGKPRGLSNVHSSHQQLVIVVSCASTMLFSYTIIVR